MVCEHLIALEREILAHGIAETYRGQAWSQNCREWVYVDCVLDVASLRARFTFDPCVEDHEHRGTHDGSEAGLVCSLHQDAIMGLHPAQPAGRPIYR